MSKFRVIVMLLFAKHWTVGICTEPPEVTTKNKVVTTGAMFSSNKNLQPKAS